MWVLGDRPYREKGPSGLGSEARRVSLQKWGWDEKERASSSNTSGGSLRKEKGYHGKNHRKLNWGGMVMVPLGLIEEEKRRRGLSGKRV
ncbi:hypothetical protein TorRG33x02_274930 [Trema orientale]|uniref:Uncharacterized protein n=1 Tax=Trema orientale TaxID=63057 RepID=A0A2P5CSA4_TREOI|nr:hypothetical protein TorRG33x02_274930 [Trema orientale]